MDASDITAIVRTGLDESADITHCELMPWTADGMKRSWRDYLIWLFTRRLKHARDTGLAAEVISQTEFFLARLAAFQPGQRLISFAARSPGHTYAGWIIDGEIVYFTDNRK